MDWEAAAAIGWCVTGTVGLAMFRSLKLPGSPEQPVRKSMYALVYGGSTASGTMAIQMLRLETNPARSGFKVVTTCSPKNVALVESYGAEKAFDYNSPSCAEDIRAYTKNTLQYAIDIIAEVKSIRLCYMAMGRAGGRYVGFELVPEDLVKDMRKTVKPDWVLGITMSGNEIAIGGGYGSKPNPELRVFGCEWFLRVEKLIHAGKLRPHPIKMQQGGLSAVIPGVGRMQRRQVSGEKLVYRLDGPASTNAIAPLESIQLLPSNRANRTMEPTQNGSLLPSEHTAIKIVAAGEMKVTDHVNIPHIKDDEILVRIHCLGLNPVDAKSTDLSPTIGGTSGCDFAGSIVAMGPALTRSLAVGDRVCGAVFGNNPEALDNGAFAEHVVVPGSLVFKIPPSMSYQTASTLGVGMSTVGLALYHKLGLPLPSPQPLPSGEKAKYVLVYGGGTATGILAIQTLRQSGMLPITTCSPQTFALSKSLGAVKSFDYMSPACGAEIHRYTEGSLEYVLDCISTVESMKICYAAIGTKGGRYMGLEAPPAQAKSIRQDVTTDWIIMFTIFNQPISWRKPFKREAQPDDRRFADGWFQIAQKLLDAGLITPLRHEEKSGGLSGVIDGVDSIRKGRVTRTKLVYPLC
ncbi:MAG: hypothetical protein Q9186_000430 [Xanthomendoza sp. 1 TL-2023]